MHESWTVPGPAGAFVPEEGPITRGTGVSGDRAARLRSLNA